MKSKRGWRSCSVIHSLALMHQHCCRSCEEIKREGFKIVPPWILAYTRSRFHWERFVNLGAFQLIYSVDIWNSSTRCNLSFQMIVFSRTHILHIQLPNIWVLAVFRTAFCPWTEFWLNWNLSSLIAKQRLGIHQGLIILPLNKLQKLYLLSSWEHVLRTK